jgi:hypothetical protein
LRAIPERDAERQTELAYPALDPPGKLRFEH